MTISVTTEFREEFEAERAAWLRRRFLWYAGFFGTIGILNLVGRGIGALTADSSQIAASQAAQLAGGVPSLILHLGGFLYVLRNHRLDRAQVLRLVYWIITIGGIIGIILAPVLARVDIQSKSGEFTPNQTQFAMMLVTTVAALVPVFISHFFASLFMPWTPREATRPLIPLLSCYALTIVFSVLFRGLPWWLALVFVAISLLVGVPGVSIAWWRHGRFRKRFSHRMLRKSYGEMKRELVDARRIHEALFPAPILEGPVRFTYVYEPMRQIGGDYLFARSLSLKGKALPLLDAIVIDVTGHGISAALTVNRLAGEIEREFGEKPDATPGEILHGLNAYLHHTLARHSVYATALCVRIDPNADELEWASAGHPSAFVRTASGRIEQLDSTTLLLGACRANDFYANQQRAAFHPGDTLLIYTDGATETRNHDGRMLRTEGMQRLIASVDPAANGGDVGGGGGGWGGWCSCLIQAIDDYRSGPVKDDTLVVEVARPV